MSPASRFVSCVLSLMLFAATAGVAPAADPELPGPEDLRNSTAGIDDARLVAADAETGNWLSHGRTYGEQRYSPLDTINRDNVTNLQHAWTFRTELPRGHEATPIVVDGVLYFTGSWSVVFAVDARSGKLLWKYDPAVPKATGAKACCDVVNRGVAVYKGRVYSGTLDGRLIALDAGTGELVWEKVTVDQSRPYTITGAPRIVEGKIILGNGGAELGVRGYFSAYDPADGTMLWRTFTVPGNPADGFESEDIAKAAPTWKGGKWWEIGGGGTVWDSMAYDPELGLLYIGTGNGSPWVRTLRSPGGGDNLYLSSILAVDPDDGHIVWYYQTTPGDTWDFTATQHMILADLEIEGRTRKVIMQAPKNGFFYVLDRTDGKLISAESYVPVTWAERIDLATGRPVEVEGQRFEEEMAFVKPTAFGGHNWHPMSFSPRTGLVYIPAQDVLGVYRKNKKFVYEPGRWNTGTDFNVYSLLGREVVGGSLIAWDPVAQKKVWSNFYAVPWNGGTLATAGDLVFQGTADGRFLAFDATDGDLLWEEQAGTGIIAAPVTYMVDDEQYVSVVAGWGGAYALAGGESAKSTNVDGIGRLITFRLGSTELPATKDVIAMLDNVSRLDDGQRLFHKYCAACHGAQAVSGAPAIPDLRHTPIEYEGFDQIVRKGLLLDSGMPNFGAYLKAEDKRLIKDYLEHRKTQGERN